MTDQKSQNLFADHPMSLTEELVNVLAENPHVRIVRIMKMPRRSVLARPAMAN